MAPAGSMAISSGSGRLGIFPGNRQELPAVAESAILYEVDLVRTILTVYVLCLLDHESLVRPVRHNPLDHHGGWNDVIVTAIAAALKGVKGAFVAFPSVLAPSPDYSEATIDQ